MPARFPDHPRARALLVILALAGCLSAGAAPPEGSGRPLQGNAAARDATAPPSPMFRMDGFMTGRNPFAGGAAGRATFPATLYMRGAASRVDFRGPRGERGLILHDSGTGRGWLADLGEGIALPTPSAGLADLVVDPERPCAHLPFKCQSGAPRFIAGTTRKGWRYRNADGRGPGGTSDGTFWLDGPRGVVVAYRGHMRGLDHEHAFEATLVQFAELPAVLFELPDVVTPEDDAATARGAPARRARPTL